MKKLILIGVLMVSLTLASHAQGKFEMGVHYSSWSTNWGIIDLEDDAPDAFQAYRGPMKLDSYGHNFGFGVRYFPGGEQGSFSIGVSYERNYFKADLSGSYTETIGDETVTRTGNGKLVLTPHSFNVDFRWEIIPRSRVHPYIGIGFGAGPLNGNATLTTVSTAVSGGSTMTTTETETLTLKEAIENIEAAQENDFLMIKFFPIVHIYFGLRGKIRDHIFVLGEVALYDGFILRGGLAYRF